MKKKLFSAHLATVLMLVAAALLAIAIGAWETLLPSPTSAAEQRSAFIQSGGLTSDVDASVPDAAQALEHARAPDSPEVAVSTF